MSFRDRSPAFDEAFYVEQYGDIRDAIAKGDISSGYEHYIRFGRDEGRQGYRFDSAWYGGSYPLALLEVKQGAAADLKQHYETIGRFRGYLPHKHAERPDNPAAIPSRFGGLWIDQANALDIVTGRLETGLITRLQSDQLREFITRGYLIIPAAVPTGEVDRALDDLERAFAGRIDGLKFESAGEHGHSAWKPELAQRAAKALDIHCFSTAVLDLALSERVRSFLQLIFEAKPLISQTLGFYRGSAQEPHQDSAYVPYTLQRSFAASWIALEDVAEGAGELFYIPGSHRLDDFLYGDRYKCVSEGWRRGVSDQALQAQIREHIAGLRPRSAQAGLSEEKFLAKRGDALIWHADLAHGGMLISQTRTRRSIVTHYCPKYAAPLYAEFRATSLHDHHGKGLWTTSHY